MRAGLSEIPASSTLRSTGVIYMEVALWTRSVHVPWRRGGAGGKKAEAAGWTEQKSAQTVLVAAPRRTGAAVTHGMHLLE